jgi:tetraacyldisaccharide 4'-kinase
VKLKYPNFWAGVTWVTILLTPLSWVIRAAVTVYHRLHKVGLLRIEHLRVPVIVVGNISVGGTGKTPLVLWLANRLRESGYQPGIISLGYGGTNKLPLAVQADSDTTLCGDEPVLLARRSHCPVWIGKNKVAAARALLAANAGCDVIISDDGLQHYRLARDVEIAVIDGARGLGNGLLIPFGPLREPPSRLRAVDAIVVRGPTAHIFQAVQLQYNMTLEPISLQNLRDTNRCVDASHFKELRVHAVAGIGNPRQFFETLAHMGIKHTPHAFADHHAFVASELIYSDCDAVVMTEKDAVKCEPFASDKQWALQVDARMDNGDALMQALLDRIKRNH